MIEKIRFENFTAFKELEVTFSPGINIIVGENSTGKTHLIKAVYAACEVGSGKENFYQKLVYVFLPSNRNPSRMVNRSQGDTRGTCQVNFLPTKPGLVWVSASFYASHALIEADATPAPNIMASHPLESVYIPSKDMLANAPGFRALYNRREIHFEEVYADLIDRATLPALKGTVDERWTDLLDKLERAIGGEVVLKNEEFFLSDKQGELEFTLLAEGYRKLGLLWLLIRNGVISTGSVLCWDEPETNLNPRLMRTVGEVLVELQRLGVQIFLTTHDYVLLKEFDLQTQADDQVIYHSLYRSQEDGEIHVASTDDYLSISPNAIDAAFGDLVGREISRSLDKAMP
ncbi:MAG: AAA family ATPase [Candidatus Poribacteria bacterium]|nr:AAA family ATPase [Candidatus Poribacteria bacterium]